MTAVPKTLRNGLPLLLALLLAAPAQALTVGRLTVATEGGKRLLKVATQGKAEPRLESPAGRLVVIIPGGNRAMKTLRVGSDPVRQIRFGRDAGDLRVVLDLSRDVKAALGAVDAKGFVVDLGPATAAAVAKAAAAEAADVPDEALSPVHAGYTYSIVDIALGGDEGHSELMISANGPASYKSAVRENGRLISLTFRNSSLAYSGDLEKLRDSSVKAVSVRQTSSRGETQVVLDVRLSQKLDYALQRDQNQILLRLDRPVSEIRSPSRGNIETLVSLEVQNADLVGVLKTLAEQAGFEYQFTKEILSKTPPESLVTIKVESRPFREVLDTLLGQVTGNFLRQGNTLYIGAQTEIDARRARLPTVSRTYAPKYLTVKQLREILTIHYVRDAAAGQRVTQGVVPDPRDSNRLLLNGTQDEVGEWLGVVGRFDLPESGEAAASTGAGGNSIKTQIFRLQYLDATQHGALITAAINQLFAEGETPPSIFIDTTTRTLVVTTQLKNLQRVEKLLARLDVRPEQVNIEGKIVEVNQSVAKQLGINWTATQQQASPNLSGNFDAGVATDFVSRLTLATVQNGFDINARIQALVNDRKADLVSSPNITVNDNQPALIESTDKLTTFKVTQTITDQGIINTTEVLDFDVPLKLQVTPKISLHDQRVDMKILFELTTATGPPPGPGVQPPTSQQSASTNVNVNSGDTAVIGGLVRQNNLTTERKIPILGDIPLLGMLFRFDTESNEKKEVIIFITPTIIQD